MSTSAIATPAVPTVAVHQVEVDRYEAVRQYSGLQIAALWAAAAGPMSIIGWIVAPWLSHHLGTSEPLGTALLIYFNAGFPWINFSVLGVITAPVLSVAVSSSV